MIKNKGSEAIANIVGSGIIAFALWQSHIKPNYDPNALVSAGIGLMTLTWMAPTEALDERIKNLADKIDRSL